MTHRGPTRYRIFTLGRQSRTSPRPGEAQNHIYDYVFTDSKIERDFVELNWTLARSRRLRQTSPWLPHPNARRRLQSRLGHCFQGSTVKHVYFIAETKGSMSHGAQGNRRKQNRMCPQVLRRINRRSIPENVKYDVVNNFGKLMELVG